MSKIGKIPVVIPQGVTAILADQIMRVSGPKGQLQFAIPKGITAKVADNLISISQEVKTQEETKALYGLSRALLANMVKGVATGFEKRLELSGVGYRANANGQELTLSVGYSHPVKIQAPAGITFAVSENVIVVSGIDKALVGDVAAKVRAVRKPEPYKGKGIKYVGEHIRRKAGKAAKTVGTK
ncbi:MAG TPA: 50S ribosomal protein L6 [Patescibacteria group bacterium]|nr:50S ribosomal protein L6 [Patescibacteria group bacterium]